MWSGSKPGGSRRLPSQGPPLPRNHRCVSDGRSAPLSPAGWSCSSAGWLDAVIVGLGRERPQLRGSRRTGGGVSPGSAKASERVLNRGTRRRWRPTDATIVGASVLDGRENHDPAAQPPGLWVRSISNRWYAFTRSMPIRGRAADGEVLVAVDDRPLDWRLLVSVRGAAPRPVLISTAGGSSARCPPGIVG